MPLKAFPHSKNSVTPTPRKDLGVNLPSGDRPENFGRASSIALVGIDGHLIQVEANISQSLPSFVLLGLPDAALNEAKERIKSAALNSGAPLSKRKITVNLTPAALPKKGSSYDLAIVMAILEASNSLCIPDKTAFIGELGLDGKIRAVPGVLPMVAAAGKHGILRCIVPRDNLQEAFLASGIQCFSYDNLREAVNDFTEYKKSGRFPKTEQVQELSNSPDNENIQRGYPVMPILDMSEVRGQYEAKLALEIAAAGGHHILMIGSPGSGKTMLAERFPSILPPLDREQALEVTAIHSLESSNDVVTLKGQNFLITRPPFEKPHHTSSPVSIVGGGHGPARPGAASRAHHGVLFLDEAPEFERKTLEALRQPLEAGEIIINRSAGVTRYPAKFQLILAANPCPCGYGLSTKVECKCSVQQKLKYLAKISGPLADRIDIHITLEPPNAAEFAMELPEESSVVVAQRVVSARSRQKERLRQYGCTLNSHVPGSVLRSGLKLSAKSKDPFDKALEQGLISARSYDRLLRLAWTIADLKGHSSPNLEDVHTALLVRGKYYDRIL